MYVTEFTEGKMYGINYSRQNLYYKSHENKINIKQGFNFVIQK